ncbi:DUF6409 family protein [Streptomyces griseus]|uniref:DUF6409 family protein n=1 Tax=Streptomyces griseus TaxID=1911 RepID=UPI0037BCDEC2
MTATSSTTITTQGPLQAGALVHCPRYVEGKNTGMRKAVVLGLFNANDPKGGYRVYFYTLGRASIELGTVCFVFSNETVELGIVEELSERTLVGICKGLAGFPGAAIARDRAARMAANLGKLRRAAR